MSVCRNACAAIGVKYNDRGWSDTAVIRGTRMTVELILRKLGEGLSVPELLDAYPRLTREDVHAALQFAADAIAHDEVVFQPTIPATDG